ncbi:LacI family DNA-binding transcriptional regulator [Parvularcula marina]|uniref:LacI family DNA-binding transcriptional regulator n=1 Tax=Parvularcula marina TaxID=2292771 RepID=UPI003512D98C
MSEQIDVPQRRGAVTIREVAEKAGVSQMTVSRVLNQPSLVKKETTRRVQEAIKALNYRPNLMARGLAGGKSLLIGLIYNNPSTNYLGEVLFGAINACGEQGHHLLVEDYLVDYESLSVSALANRFRESGVDGLIVVPPCGEVPKIARALKESGVHCVNISGSSSDSDTQFVAINEAGAAGLMTSYLLEKGHRKIGFITGDMTHVSSGERQRGFIETLKANGIKPNPDYIVEGAFTYRSGMEGAQQLLGLKDPPTAIFASNDDMAAGVISAVQQLGLQVPSDISVAGFDDTAIARTIWPGLTTVRQPISEMASQAVTLFSNREAAGDANGSVLDVTLTIRDSVVAPKKM